MSALYVQLRRSELQQLSHTQLRELLNARLDNAERQAREGMHPNDREDGSNGKRS